MSENTPVQFDIKAVQERIVDTVRGTFGMLIPEDKWNEMVQREIEAYYTEEAFMLWHEEDVKDTNSNWSGATKKVNQLKIRMTPFRQLVWSELHLQNTKQLQEYFAGPNFKAIVAYGDYEQAQLSDMLSKKLDELVPKMAAAMFSNMFAQAVQGATQQLKQELMQNRPY